jgi:dihydrofolate reductase
VFDNEAATFLSPVYQRADAFLFGRRTYEIFPGSWASCRIRNSNPIAAALNARPSTRIDHTHRPYVGRHDRPVRRPRGLGRRAESQTGGELQVHAAATDPLATREPTVDEITLLVCPVVIGQGTRLFPAGRTRQQLELVYSRSTPKGVTIQVYRPAGRPQYETATPTSST